VCSAYISHEIKQCKTIIRFWNRARNYETGSGQPVTITRHWKVVHQCVLTCSVCSHWWTTFQLLSLWLTHVDRTVTSNDTCIVISHLSRIQVLQPLHFTTDITVCWNCGSLVTSQVYFSLSIIEVTFDLAWLWKVRGRFALVRSALAE